MSGLVAFFLWQPADLFFPYFFSPYFFFLALSFSSLKSLSQKVWSRDGGKKCRSCLTSIGHNRKGQKDRSGTEWTKKNKGEKCQTSWYCMYVGWWRQVVVTVRFAFLCLFWGFPFLFVFCFFFCLLRFKGRVTSLLTTTAITITVWLLSPQRGQGAHGNGNE